MSCCECITIRVNGQYLDLPEGFSLEQYKLREQTTTEGITSAQQSIEQSVRLTPKNRTIAGDLVNPAKVGPQYLPTACVVKENGRVLDFNEIQFLNASDAANSLSFKMRKGSTHWAEQAGATQLPELETLGNYTFTKSFVDSTHTSNAAYNDGDLGVWFPLVNFGKFLRGRDLNWNQDNDPDQAPVEFSESQIVVEDYRPHFHLLSILQKGFAHLGWSYRCPILETSTGRRLGCYLLDKGLGTDEDFLNTAKYEATLPADPNPQGETFSVEVLDNGDNFANGQFSLPGVYDFTVVFRGTQTVYEEREGEDPELFLYLYKYSPDGTVVEQLFIQQVRGRAFNDFIEIKGVELIQGQYVKAFIQGQGVRISIDEARVYNTPKKVIISRGQLVEIRDIIGDYNFLDLIKGWGHIINARYVTDPITRTVWMYSPYDVEYYGEAVDGFLLETIDDWTQKVMPESADFSFTGANLNRYHRFAFAESGDSAIKALELGEDVEYLEKLVDLGSDYPGQVSEYRNPFFQAIVNEQMSIFFPDYISNGLANQRPYLPQMLDNDQGNLSYDIGPRLLYFAGLTTQENEAGTKQSYFRYEGGPRQQVPYAYMVPNEDVFVAGSRPEIRLAYGDYTGLDFYELFYRESFLRGIVATNLGLSVKLSANDFYSENFRSLKKIFYRGQTMLAQLLELPSRSSCSKAPIQSVVSVEPFRGDYGGGTVEVDGCNNLPRIDVSFDFDAGSITATANNTGISSTIDTDTWEYSTDEGGTYLAYTVGTAITGQASVVFKRAVTFTDGCSEKVVTRVADLTGQCSNSPGISVNYNEILDELTATRSGTFNSPIDADNLFVTIDGGTEVSYTEGAALSSFSTAVFRRAVTFTNACPEVEVISSFDLAEQPCVNQPAIQFTEVATGVYNIAIAGTLTSVILYSDIQVSFDDGATWRNWNRSPVVAATGFKVRAIIYYSDGCPRQVITADCPA